MTHTQNESLIAKAIAKFPEARAVVLVDHVRAMSAVQLVHTAAAYSQISDGVDVMLKCSESFERQGYGTHYDFLKQLLELLESKANQTQG